MAVVLGKRASPFDVVVKSSPRSTRSRRVISVIDGDEEIGDSIVVRAESSVVSELDITPRTPKRTRRTAPLPPPPASSARAPLSPQKVNAVFKSTKSTPGATKSSPKTPRHRDAVVKKPTTPRHRVSVVSKPMTPRSKLFATPTHASTPSSTVITTAKSLFSRSTQGGRLIGRETERTKLHSFLKSRLAVGNGGCLYISGPPGCGKSALLTEIMGELAGDQKHSVRKAWINCMSLHTPGSIYASLLESFSSVASVRTAGSATDLSDLEALFVSSKKGQTFVLVLDEIDHLLSHDLLPTLFELSLRKNSRLILVGIANALDLTDRFLPRLKAKNLEPELLPFLPYTAPQISEVLTARLRSLLSPAEKESCEASFLPFVHPAAIQLLSRKVAAASGDLRKAFDILRRALELVEMESWQALRAGNTKSQPLSLAVLSPPRLALAETTLNSPSVRASNPAIIWTPSTAPRASLAHVAKASSSTLGASISARVAKLNAHQKAVLCVLVARSGTAPYAMQKLRDAYTKACKGDGVALMPLVGAEFRGVVDAMEAVGVLDLLPAVAGKKAAAGGEERVVSRVGKMELLTAVSAESTKGREGLVAILGS